LSLSWLIYFANNGFHAMPTGAQFEYAFPMLTWQILFVHGLVIGYYRDEIWNFFHSKKGGVVFIFIVALFFAFLFFTYNNPIPQIPSYLRLEMIDPKTFHSIYQQFFPKNTLGIGRLINDFVLLIVSYALLSYFWKPISKLFGKFFVPIGQASLYVFVLHVFVVILMANIPLFNQGNFWINTLGLTAVFIFMWLMVKFKVGYSFIPR